MTHTHPKNADQVNIALMLASCAMAYALPLEMVLLSYAFLGPAHYLTQISWMHDKNYFTDNKMIWAYGLALTSLIITAIYMPFMGGNNTIYNIYVVALAGACAVIITPKIWQRLSIFIIIAAVFLVIRGVFPGFVLGLIILLPSVVHIYIFTGCFILYGAFKSQNIWGFASFWVFIACGALFFFIRPSEAMIAPIFVTNNIGMFDGIAAYLANLLSFRGWVDGHAVLGFLAFAYTYHYLNWFSKVNIIKWNDMSKRRLISLSALYLLCIGTYLYDYRTGFVALLFLSILHVLLELPLNVLTIKSLGRSVISIRFKPSAASR